MTKPENVYYQAIKDPHAYMEVYRRMRAEPTNALQMRAIFELLPDLEWPEIATLELACGGGLFTEELVSRGVRQASCCDIEPTCIAACRLTNPGARVVQSDVTTLPFAAHEFDLILATDIIEHVPDHEAMLAEMYRVLKPGGHVLISTQNDRSLEHFLGLAVSRLRGCEWKGWDPTHLRFYNAASLRALLREQGFTNIRFNGTYYLPFHFFGRLLGKPLEMLGVGSAARLIERGVALPFYVVNAFFEVLSLRYPLNELGWSIIVTARKA